MSVECLRCGRVLTSNKSIELGYGRKCYKITRLFQEKNKVMGLEKLLERVRKLELDNTFMRYQLKHKAVVSNQNIESIERIKQDKHRPERNEFKVQFNVIVKELKVIFNNNETILKKDFRFNNEELGIKTSEEIIKILN